MTGTQHVLHVATVNGLTQVRCRCGQHGPALENREIAIAWARKHDLDTNPEGTTQ